eukprot:SAG31_NODE_1545_length_7942_cov_6.001020_8_plen_681_part_00
MQQGGTKAVVEASAATGINWETIDHLRRGEELRRLRAGGPISADLRRSVWCAAAQTKRQQECGPSSYQDFLRAGQENDKFDGARYQILQDLPRTMPDQPEFYCDPDEEITGDFSSRGQLVPALERVLVALCAKDPSTGYCQGLNFIVALMLLVARDEEEAFWLSSGFLDLVLPPSFHGEQLCGAEVEWHVFDELLRVHLPELATHLRKAGLPLHVFTTSWFITLFSSALPADAVFPIWDAMLLTAGSVRAFDQATNSTDTQRDVVPVDRSPRVGLSRCCGLNEMMRSAIAFFKLHESILATMATLVELKSGIEMLLSSVSSSTAVAMTTPALTSDIADNVIDAIRARARRHVNMQRRQLDCQRSRQQEITAVYSLSREEDMPGQKHSDDQLRRSQATALARAEAEVDEESAALLEFFIADDPAAGSPEGGFHAFVGSPTVFPPNGKLAWAHLYLLLAEEQLPPPEETAIRLIRDFLLPPLAMRSSTAAVSLSDHVQRLLASTYGNANMTSNTSEMGMAAVQCDSVDLEKLWIAIWSEIRSFLLNEALPQWLRSPACRLKEHSYRTNASEAPIVSQTWPTRIQELVRSARQRQAVVVLQYVDCMFTHALDCVHTHSQSLTVELRRVLVNMCGSSQFADRGMSNASELSRINVSLRIMYLAVLLTTILISANLNTKRLLARL